MMAGMRRDTEVLLPLPQAGEGWGQRHRRWEGRSPSFDLNTALTPSPSPAGRGENTAWQARLDLGFQRRDAATLLSRREHVGP